MTTAADERAQKYFGESGAPRDTAGLAEYYRSRRIGCVVFSVDEKLSGRPQVLMVQTRAKATLRLAKDDFKGAIGEIEEGIDKIREFYQKYSRIDLLERGEMGRRTARAIVSTIPPRVG